MKTFSKSVTGALAAALLTTAVATPAEAQRYRRYDDRRGNGVSLGDVVLGTIAIGGVAVVLGALGSRDRYERGYQRGSGYGDDRQASIEACAYEAQREAGRRFGGQARVRDIDAVDRSRDGYRVRGTIQVQSDYGYGRSRYDRGDERVHFSCSAYNGRVTGLNVGSNYAYDY